MIKLIDYKRSKKTENFEEMIEIARRLSKDFPHVRVDLYNIDGKIYFGELTFYNANDYKNYQPEEFDFIVGNKFKLPKPMKKYLTFLLKLMMPIHFY